MVVIAAIASSDGSVDTDKGFETLRVLVQSTTF